MGKKPLLFYACLLVVCLPSVVFGDEVFDPVKVVHMKNGEALQCQMASIEGTRMVCRKANGSVSVPLQSVDLGKTFPKYMSEEGQILLLVHAGQLFRDENTIISNLRMVREEQNGQMGTSPVMILCDVINRSDPCEIRVSVLAKDRLGSSQFAIDLDSDARVGKDQRAVLRRRLGSSESKLENQINSLKVGDVERRNPLSNGEDDPLQKNLRAEKLRERKIRSLKEVFLR